MMAEAEAPAAAGPGIYIRGIAMAETEEFVSGKQQQKEVPTGISLKAVIPLGIVEEQNLSGELALFCYYLNIYILYGKTRIILRLVCRDRQY